MKKRRFLLLTLISTMFMVGCKNTEPKVDKIVTIKVINGTGGGDYKYGDLVTITADQLENKDFDHWESREQYVSKGNPYIFTAKKNATYTAIFSRKKVQLDVVNGTGSGKYEIGSQVTVKAFVLDKLKFTGWTINDELVSSFFEYKFVIEENTTISAIYETMLENSDDDKLPGHEQATLMNGSKGFEDKKFAIVEDWYNSGKSLYFEVKRLENNVMNMGETVRFSLLGNNYNPGVYDPKMNWNRLTEHYLIDFKKMTCYENNTTDNVAEVQDLNDGWYSFTIPLNAFSLNIQEYAFGTELETLRLIYFDNVKRGFKIDHLSVK